nr:unnamed protein product [Callosobruchus analis]
MPELQRVRPRSGGLKAMRAASRYALWPNQRADQDVASQPGWGAASQTQAPREKEGARRYPSGSWSEWGGYRVEVWGGYSEQS